MSNLFNIFWNFSFKEIYEFNKFYKSKKENIKCIPYIFFGRSGELTMFPISTKCIGSLFDIHAFRLMWKDKYNSPRYEYFPFINITFLHKWQISIQWIINTSKYSGYLQYQDEWWERFLRNKYYNK